MKVQTKLVLLMLTVMSLFTGGIVFLRQATIRNAESLLEEKEREKASYFDKLVRLKGASLQTLAYDYTYWDEMVHFVESGDPHWAETTLNHEVLSNYAVDALWVYRTDFTLVYSINALKDGTLDEIPLPMGARDRVLQDSRFCHFFLQTPQGPLEIRGATIHPSDDSDRKTPPQGYFFVGRLWNGDYVNELAKLTESSISIGPATAEPVPAVAAGGEGVTRFSRALPGWDGTSLQRVDVTAESPTIGAAYRAARQEVTSLIGCAVILTVVLFLSLIRWVSVPLQLVSRSLDSQDPKLLARLATDRAEFGQMAAVIQRFFAQKDELVREIAERKRAEEQLRHDAFHDALTGLANRALFVDRLANAMARARRWNESAFAVLFIDLDRFKVTNDSLGHLIGDQLLCAVSRRLVRCVRAGDLVARLGGDEFAMLLEGVRNAETPVMIAERVQSELELSFEIGGHEVYTSASIGIALSSSAYDRPEELVRDADTAMYQAKTLGKARHVVFHDALGHQVMTLMSLETDLRRAIERGELRVHYQPMVSLASGRVIGLEALVRWEHPERGLMPAAEFVPLAEESGLISAIDRWVLREACERMRGLDERSATEPPLLLAVNISSKQFAQSGMVSRIERTLEETGFDPRRLRLEITESAIIENAETAAKALARLNALGIQLCLDDFGTGYSSLSYLQQLPVDSLKIDRRFSSRMVEDGDVEIVRTIVLLARKLGMNVVAEGVETVDQLTRLRALECQFAQGYLFSRPLDSHALDVFLESRAECPGGPERDPSGVDTAEESPIFAS